MERREKGKKGGSRTIRRAGGDHGITRERARSVTLNDG